MKFDIEVQLYTKPIVTHEQDLLWLANDRDNNSKILKEISSYGKYDTVFSIVKPGGSSIRGLQSGRFEEPEIGAGYASAALVSLDAVNYPNATPNPASAKNIVNYKICVT